MITGIIAYFKAFTLSLMLMKGGIATQFGEYDKYNPNPHLACLSKVDVKDSIKVVAHRTLQCGTLITVCRPDLSKCTEAVVADRGPFGCKIKGKDGCLEYKSQLDMTKAVGDAIDHNGYEAVIFLEKQDTAWEKKKRLREIKRQSKKIEQKRQYQRLNS